MTKWIACIAALVSVAHSAIPTTAGWHELPNTKLKAVAPPANFGGTNYNFNFASYSVTEAWSGGAFDFVRNQLLIWGGGHGDYYGNEIYALDLNTEKMLRLTDPATPIAPVSPTIEQLYPNDGTQPNGRHTYDGLCYMPNHDVMWAFGGSLSSGDGGNSSWTWIYYPATKTWKHVVPKGANPGTNAYLGVVSAFDSATGAIYFHQRNGFYKYVYDSQGGTYTQLTGYNSGQLNFSMTGVFDPKRRKFIVLGNGDQHIFDFNSSGGYQALGSTGAAALISHQGPGLAYDPVTDRIIGWATGDNVYSLNVDTRVWTSQSFSGGPHGSTRGAYGRFDYVPGMDLFVTYNTKTADGYSAPDANAYVLRIRPSTKEEGNGQGVKGMGRMEVSPNPFRSSTVLQFSGAAPEKLFVFDLRGRQVSQLGVHQGRAVFEGKDAQGRALTPGIYTAVFRAGKGVKSAKLFLVE